MRGGGGGMDEEEDEEEERMGGMRLGSKGLLLNQMKMEAVDEEGL